MKTQALIADIRRLTLHDGPGTRTTVFVKGCPLHCLWCHNPESISAVPQLLFHEKLCVSCRDCAAVCPNGVHSFADGHRIDRTRCTLCGKCVDACLANALTLCGVEMTSEKVFKQVMKDAAFYGTEGGVTVSGGEPLVYPEFVRDLFTRLHEKKIHTALDTCGEAPWERFETVLPVTDLVLFDLKGMDPEQHRINTGKTNERIHENLLKLAEKHIPVEIRMPVIPGCNDAPEEFHAAGKLLARVQHTLTRVRLLAYHSMARQKYHAAGLPDTMPRVEAPSHELLADRRKILASYIPGTEIILPPLE